jgi:hypothetical protein
MIWAGIKHPLRAHECTFMIKGLHMIRGAAVVWHSSDTWTEAVRAHSVHKVAVILPHHGLHDHLKPLLAP